MGLIIVLKCNDMLSHSNDTAVPVVYAIVRKPIHICDLDTKQEKRKNTITKN